MNAEQQRYYQQKLQAEQRLTEKARNLLLDYGDVRVEANVELDTTAREETELVKYADKPKTVETSTSKKDSESSRAATGGRVGTEPNAIANRSQSLANQPESSNKSKEQQESERKIVGQETTLSEKVGFRMKSASLSVSIPMSYYSLAHRREWLELNPDTPVPKMESADLKNRKEGTQKKIQALLAKSSTFVARRGYAPLDRCRRLLGFAAGRNSRSEFGEDDSRMVRIQLAIDRHVYLCRHCFVLAPVDALERHRFG